MSSPERPLTTGSDVSGGKSAENRSYASKNESTADRVKEMEACQQ